MTGDISRGQLVTLLAIIASIVVVCLAPIIVTGIMGKVVPDSLIAASDKCITGLIGVLGTLVGAWGGRKVAQP